MVVYLRKHKRTSPHNYYTLHRVGFCVEPLSNISVGKHILDYDRGVRRRFGCCRMMVRAHYTRPWIIIYILISITRQFCDKKIRWPDRRVYYTKVKYLQVSFDFRATIIKDKSTRKNGSKLPNRQMAVFIENRLNLFIWLLLESKFLNVSSFANKSYTRKKVTT